MLEGIQNIKYHDPFEKIKRATVISFDIFDTAIIRPFLHHREMYYISEKELNAPGFHNIRINAENKARKNIIEKGFKEDITLLDVYENININAQKAINTEIIIDINICGSRPYIYKLYRFAINLGKKVIFISDITYPRKAIINILHKNGYDKYHTIYISSEEMLSKAKGGLYKRVIEDLDLNPNKILHIGDSINADIQQAKLHGIQTLYIPRPYHELQKILNCKKYKMRSSAINSALFASAANTMFNNPVNDVSRKHLIALPVCYHFTSDIFNKNQHNNTPIIAIIHSNHSNTLFHICNTIYKEVYSKTMMSCDVNINHIYAASIRTFMDLQTLAKALPTLEFQLFLRECYGINVANTSELLLSWHAIEMSSLQIRQNIIEKFDGIQNAIVYDFTFEHHIHTTIQKIFNNTIATYYNAQDLILHSIESITMPSFFMRPNSAKILIEMQSLTNEETQRYIIPQITYFKDKLAQYLDKI